jgi:hypothetical protein
MPYILQARRNLEITTTEDWVEGKAKEVEWSAPKPKDPNQIGMFGDDDEV